MPRLKIKQQMTTLSEILTFYIEVCVQTKYAYGKFSIKKVIEKETNKKANI